MTESEERPAQKSLPGVEAAAEFPEPGAWPDTLIVTGYCYACGKALRMLPALPGQGLDARSMIEAVSGCCAARIASLCVPIVSTDESPGFQKTLRLPRFPPKPTPPAPAASRAPNTSRATGSAAERAGADRSGPSEGSADPCRGVAERRRT